MKSSILGIATFAMASAFAIAANNQQASSIDCKSTPCSNTATGESPADKAQRESEAITEQIKLGNDDKERWARVSLYSDSTEANDLNMIVTKSGGLAMRLDPARGHLEFNSKGTRRTFAIATPQGEKRTTCPKYNVRIIEASAIHAVLRRVCNEFEFRPSRFVASVDYFLYDVASSTLRTIWHNESTTKGAPIPVAKPIPTVRTLPNGYQFDWRAQAAGGDSGSPREIHTSYVRKKIDGAHSLICTDNSAPKGQGLEAGYCEGERPSLIESR